MLVNLKAHKIEKVHHHIRSCLSHVEAVARELKGDIPF